MKDLKIHNYKATEEEFNAMSIIDKRTYIIQTEQDETNWWLRTMAKINVICFIVGLVLGVLALFTMK